jgi:RHS repeat-associated protein
MPNRRSEKQSDEGETRFEWDANSRLIGAQTPNGEKVRYAYDPLGRRISKEVDGRRTDFFWDGDTLLGDTGGGHREFTFYPGSFVPLSMHGATDEFYFQNDHVGLPHDVYSSHGDLVWSARYGPFGDANKIVEIQDNPLRLQGQYYDAETGLYYNRFRYFDPSVGKFISADPLGLDAGPDLYRYAPSIWSWIDPLGLSCSSDAAKLRKNMIANRKRPPVWPHDAHHIVQSGKPMADVKKHMAKYGVDINSHHNGVFLPSSKAVVKEYRLAPIPSHKSLHTPEYQDAVRQRILSQHIQTGIINELNQIKAEILKGRFP